MERRARETEEFYQEQEEECVPSSAIIKSDDSEDDDWTNKSSTKETKLPENEPSEEPPEVSAEVPVNETPENIDMQTNECQEIEALTSTFEPLPSTSEQPPTQSNDSEHAVECIDDTEIVEKLTESENQMDVEQPKKSDPVQASHSIEFHTERTELDDELDAMLEAEIRPKPSIPTGFVPKLKGGDGFVIDFETNDLKPKSQDGVQELFSRFLKNACVKKNATAETQSVR